MLRLSYEDSYSETVDVRALSSFINTEHRAAVLKWLFESLELLTIEERVFFATVVLADRYCARVAAEHRDRPRSIEGSDLQLIILSSLCCSLKSCESSLDMSVKGFLEHISGGHVNPKDIFVMEAKLLSCLDFHVFNPSFSVYIESFFYVLSRTTIESLSSPLEQPQSVRPLPDWAAMHYYLSLFLLYLIAFHVETLHAVRPPLLVSACILTAAFTLSDKKLESIEFQTILEALVEAGWVDSQTHDVSFIVRHMTRFWKRAPDEIGEAAYKSICNLFDTDQRHHVSRINPPRVGSDVITSGG